MPKRAAISFRLPDAVVRRLDQATAQRELPSRHRCAQQILTEALLAAPAEQADLHELRELVHDLREQLESFRARFEDVVSEGS